LASAQRETALALARDFGFAHRVVLTSEVEDPLYARNDANRCFHCKTELFRHLLPIAAAEGYRHVAYGAIVDDLSDFRPGHRAAASAGVRSPLLEAEMTKADIRELSREMGLPTWDLPASPCLSSRIPRGTAVTPGILRQVERAEEAVRALGLRELRVRHLGETARVEIAPAELAGLSHRPERVPPRPVERAAAQDDQSRLTLRYHSVVPDAGRCGSGAAGAFPGGKSCSDSAFRSCSSSCSSWS
jgi:uncharacterized protein